MDRKILKYICQLSLQKNKNYDVYELYDRTLAQNDLLQTLNYPDLKIDVGFSRDLYIAHPSLRRNFTQYILNDLFIWYLLNIKHYRLVYKSGRVHHILRTGSHFNAKHFRKFNALYLLFHDIEARGVWITQSLFRMIKFKTSIIKSFVDTLIFDDITPLIDDNPEEMMETTVKTLPPIIEMLEKDIDSYDGEEEEEKEEENVDLSEDDVIFINSDEEKDEDINGDRLITYKQLKQNYITNNKSLANIYNIKRDVEKLLVSKSSDKETYKEIKKRTQAAFGNTFRLVPFKDFEKFRENIFKGEHKKPARLALFKIKDNGGHNIGKGYIPVNKKGMITEKGFEFTKSGRIRDSPFLTFTSTTEIRGFFLGNEILQNTAQVPLSLYKKLYNTAARLNGEREIKSGNKKKFVSLLNERFGDSEESVDL